MADVPGEGTASVGPLLPKQGQNCSWNHGYMRRVSLDALSVLECVGPTHQARGRGLEVESSRLGKIKKSRPKLWSQNQAL